MQTGGFECCDNFGLLLPQFELSIAVRVLPREEFISSITLPDLYQVTITGSDKMQSNRVRLPAQILSGLPHSFTLFLGAQL